jgi:hypothetical protein
MRGVAKRVLFGALAAAALAVAGCESLPGGESRAMKIALTEYAKHGGLGHVQTQAFHAGGLWRVTIWTAPDKDGGFVVVEVNSMGKVVSYTQGN